MSTFHKGNLPPTADLLAFEAASRHESISRAAAELHLTQSAVSRKIQQLESHLGLPLFHRVRQRVVLTDVGRSYAHDVRVALSDFSNATLKAMAMSEGGSIFNLAVLPTLGTRWLIPRLKEFNANNPRVVVNLAARTEPFDFTREPFDAAIHYGSPHWASARCEYLMHEETVAVCSPEYQRQHRVNSFADLDRVVLLQQSTRPNQWAEWLQQVHADNVHALHGPRFEQFAMIAQAAVSSLGVALLPSFLVEAEIAQGDLIILFDQVKKSDDAYYLVYPESRAETPILQSFRKWLMDKARNQAAR